MLREAVTLLALILSIALLVSGNAFLMTLLGVRLSLEAFSPAVIGWILVAYSAGFVIGTLYAARAVDRVGHIRAFAVFAAALACTVLIYPISVATPLWAGLRAIGGFSMAGLMIVMESWFSSRATNENRARLFAVYQVVFFLSTAGGQLLIVVGDPAGFLPFALATILITLAVIPLSLTRMPAPPLESGARMSLRELSRVSPVGMAGGLIAGLLISAFYTMGPVYADRIGLPVERLAVFMASAIVAAMILALPVGRLCDRFNRRRVMLGTATIAAASSLAAAAAGALFLPLLIVAAGLFMGLSAALYPISVAITNDRMESDRIVAASTTLLLSYGIGTCIGPIATSAAMEILGPAGLFVGNALFLLGLAGFVHWQGGRLPDIPVAQQEHFRSTMPEAAVGLAELDPRNTRFTPVWERVRRFGKELQRRTTVGSSDSAAAETPSPDTHP